MRKFAGTFAFVFICFLFCTSLAEEQIGENEETDSIDQTIINSAMDASALEIIQSDSHALLELDLNMTIEQVTAYDAVRGKENGMDKRKAVALLNMRWPNATMSYYIEATAFNGEDITNIKMAMNIWSRVSCVRFKEVAKNDRVLKAVIKDGEGCSSQLGRVQDLQEVHLGTGCRGVGTILHELGHSLGFFHEQSRPDRDDFITINEANIVPGDLPQFQKMTTELADTHNVPYDYSSIMHYGETYFSKNNKPTIVTRDPKYQKLIGQREMISFNDAKGMNAMYSCGKSCSNKNSCPANSFIGQDCQCYCASSNKQEVVKVCGGSSVTTTAPRTTARASTTKKPNCTDAMPVSCPAWKRRGDCNSNRAFMSVNCPLTCGFCYNNPVERELARYCVDLNPNCEAWAAIGFCREYEQYMSMQCEYSCGFCVEGELGLPYAPGNTQSPSHVAHTGNRQTTTTTRRPRWSWSDTARRSAKKRARAHLMF